MYRPAGAACIACGYAAADGCEDRLTHYGASARRACGTGKSHDNTCIVTRIGYNVKRECTNNLRDGNKIGAARTGNRGTTSVAPTLIILRPTTVTMMNSTVHA